MKNQITELISAETGKAWGLGNGYTYDPYDFWISLKKVEKGIPLSKLETSMYMKAYISCTTIEMNRKWPSYGEGRGDIQQDILSDSIFRLISFYEADPQSHLFKYIPTAPKTIDEKRRLHKHLKWKARKEIETSRKMTEKQSYHKDSFSIDYDLEDEICKHQEIEEVELTGLDDYVISQSNNVDAINNEVLDIINNFFIRNAVEYDSVLKSFNNRSFRFDNYKDIWKMQFVNSDLPYIWMILNKIDSNVMIVEQEKKDLILFYLLICVVALYEKQSTSVNINSYDNVKIAIITKEYVDILASLTIKTFLFFTNNLKQNVFCKIETPPPTSKSDITKFKNSIKRKPQELLKNTKLPTSIIVKPATLGLITMEEVKIPDLNNLHEIFESYEVFEEFIEKVNYAFENSTFNHIEIQKVKGLQSLMYHLEEKNISIESIFSFLNPDSLKENNDFNYLTQGTVSSITSQMMNTFKHDEKNLFITLTNGESSLNLEKIAEASAYLLSEMIENDFDIRSNDVTSIAAKIVGQVQNKIDIPFSVPIPEGSEYDSFRMMIEMNGPIKVSIPFSTQGEKPFWSDEKVLDDKMVQIVDESIKNAINKADIGKSILKYL